MDSPNKRFRIALSFAGEKRAYVEQVAAILARQFGKERILYGGAFKAAFIRVHMMWDFNTETRRHKDTA